MQPLHKIRRDFSGVAMVEYIIVLPVLLLLMIATAEIGRAFLQYNALTKGLQDGARFAASVAAQAGGGTGVDAFDAGDAARVRNMVVYGHTASTGTTRLPGLVPANVTVALNGAGDVDVAVTYAFQAIFPTLPMFGLRPDITPNYQMQANITMRPL